MESMEFYALGRTKACQYARSFLQDAGIPFADHPKESVTHLLLDVPSFSDSGQLRGGEAIAPIMRELPERVTVIGGNLNHPALAGCPCLDLLKDEGYVAENAAITAHCALKDAAQRMEMTFSRCPVLVIGWGRIGKCLGALLRRNGALVTVAARKASDRAMLAALGYEAASIGEAEEHLKDYRLIFNTAPEMVYSAETLACCQNCLKIDLASKKGLGGKDVIWARGLPGILAPEASGRLIGETVLRLCGRN